jgi:hypothetical protein
VFVFSSFVGCGGSPDTRTPAAYFRDTQNTETPHGKIRAEMAVENNGRIEYQTADGKWWSTKATKQTSGAYKYEDLKQVSNAQSGCCCPLFVDPARRKPASIRQEQPDSV